MRIKQSRIEKNEAGKYRKKKQYWEEVVDMLKQPIQQLVTNESSVKSPRVKKEFQVNFR